MTSRGGLNQSLQLCTEFQALVRIWTFVTKPVRIWSGFLPEIRIFSPKSGISRFGLLFSRNWSGFGLNLVSQSGILLETPPNIYLTPRQFDQPSKQGK